MYVGRWVECGWEAREKVVNYTGTFTSTQVPASSEPNAPTGGMNHHNKLVMIQN